MSDTEVIATQSANLAAPHQALDATLTTFLKNFLSPETQTAYAADWREFAKYLKSIGEVPPTLAGVTEGHLIAYRDHLRANLAPTSINRKLSSLSSLFRHLKILQLVKENPVESLRRPKAIAKRRRTGFTDQEVNKILDSIDEKTPQGLNDKTMLAFLFYTGARVSEMLSTRVRDIEVIDGIAVVHLRGKGEKLRTLPIVKVWKSIQELITRRNKEPNDYLFTSIKSASNGSMSRVGVHKIMKRHLKKLGLDTSRSAHSARRTVISNLLESGERLELVQKVAGHSSPTVTLRCYNVREEPLSKNPLLNLRYRE